MQLLQHSISMKELEIDWKLAQTLFAQGVTLKAIAHNLGCNTSTLRSRSSREHWKQVAEEGKQIIAKVDFAARTQAWPVKIADIVEKHIEALSKKDPETLKLRDLEAFSNVLERIDKVARRNFGLDQEGAKTINIGVNIDLGESDQLAVLAGETIDV